MTTRVFVTGHPVNHSRSPLIFKHWFSKYQIEGDYTRIDVTPDALSGFVAEVRAGSHAGGNVTVPHKQAMRALCDDIDEAARAIGAVNTIKSENGRIFGMNTDWYGFLANLDQKRPGWDEMPGPAIVLGAGGAARGIVYALSLRGFSPIHIVNRTLDTAKDLAADLSPSVSAELHAARLPDFDSLAPKARIVVNTTTIGMHGTRFDALDLARLSSDALVNDIVYIPLETPLLADAKALGLPVVDGLGMLLHQAVPAFEAWFGFRPEVTQELRTLVERDMGLS